jgi:fructokinase
MKGIETDTLWGGIEAGGTKFICAVGTSPDDIRSRVQFPTTSPEQTMEKVLNFFRQVNKKDHINAIGIGSFGPLNLEPASRSYGCITVTPKEGWEHINLSEIIGDALGIPVALDTDVNASALGEQKWGAAQGLDTFIYITVGTGIGGGGIINGQLMHGLVHPEMGHILVPHDCKLDPFAGCCPFHGDCLEGLASGAAMEKRWAQPPEKLPPEHPAWELESTYLAVGAMNFICTLSPRRIIMGGGVMKQPNLISKVRQKTKVLLNGYIDSAQILEKIDSYILLPGLGDHSGVLGAIALAMKA